jgi:hypothetical protein
VIHPAVAVEADEDFAHAFLAGAAVGRVYVVV